MTTPRDSFCLFAWNYRELANSLLTLCDRSEGGFEPGPFEQGFSDLTTRESSPIQKCEICFLYQPPGYRVLVSISRNKVDDNEIGRAR